MSNKARRLKVLHVIPSVATCRGGPSKAVLEMVSALREIDIDAEIATTNDDGISELDVELNTLLDYHGVPVRFFKRYSPKLHALREFAYSKQFKSWLKRHLQDYDLVHVHALFSFCSSYAMWLARQHSVPYIVRPIGQLEAWSLNQSKLKKAIYLSLVEKANLEGASAVHFTARSEQEQALTRFKNLKPCIIELGINSPKKISDLSRLAREHWQLPEQAPCLVFLSRLHPKKGLELLLNSFNQCSAKGAQLSIAGDGDSNYVRGLKALSTRLGLDRQCRFIGFIDGHEKNILLQRADLFCLTSYSENFGIAVLEAMANGATPMVSDQVALANQIKKEALGYVCELNQNDISSNLSSALNNLVHTRELGHEARNYVVQNYQWSAFAESLLVLYQRVLKNQTSK